MMKQNILERILYYTTLAPSPHNVQGWKFEWKDNTLTIFQDASRSVQKELDPNEHESMIAFGALAVNLEIAAASEGYVPSIQWLTNSTEKNRMATVTFQKSETHTTDHRLQTVANRTFNRSPYKQQAISPEILSELQTIATNQNCTLHIITEQHAIKKLAKIAGLAGRMKFGHEETHRELYRFLRFDSNDCAQHRDGLPLEHFFIPSLLAKFAKIGMNWHFMNFFRSFGYARILSHIQETLLIESSPVVCFLTSNTGERMDYVRGGEVFQKINLRTTELGIGMQPHSAVCELNYMKNGHYFHALPEQFQKEATSLANELEHHFDYDATPYVINFFRLGYPTKHVPSKTPRRRVQDVLEIVPPSTEEKDFSYEELTVRNFPFVSKEDQCALQNAKIGFAGCGSIGGAPVETLVRLGVQKIILAEPSTFELNNLNRQQATLSNIGENKAFAIWNRVKEINPNTQCDLLLNGITKTNIHYFVGASDVVIDGVDITEKKALEIKMLLHEEAWKQRRTVISGYDIAGTQLLKIYDYRTASAPLDGKFKGVSPESLTPLQFLSRVISPLDLPIEMIPVTEKMINSPEASIPQLGPTAELFSVLSSWAAYDIIAGRKIKKRLRIDIPYKLRRKRDILYMEVVKIFGIIRLKMLLQKKLKASNGVNHSISPIKS
ncbi:MAG: ThiF family adenylyltransferase [Bacilli bacterium]